MSFPASILSDEEAVDFSRLGGPAGAGEPSASRHVGEFELRVLTLLLRQVSDLALLIAASASIVNRLEHDVAAEMPEAALMAHLPALLSPDTELTHALIRSNLPIEIVAETQGFYTRLAAVRAMTASHCRFPAGVAAKGGVHIETLAGGWRELARQTRRLIVALASLAAGVDVATAEAVGGQRYGRTLYLLAACVEGASPCVLADGTVEIPDIVERRRHQRFTVDWLGYAYIADCVADVRIVDVSAGGLCMVAAGIHTGSGPLEALPQTGRVVVEIVGHGRLPGVIAWHAAQSYGIMFERALQAGHPLLAAARGLRRT